LQKYAFFRSFLDFRHLFKNNLQKIVCPNKIRLIISFLIYIYFYQRPKKDMKLSSVYIVAAKRTAIGSFLGKISNFTGPQLGGFAIKGALESINLNPKEVDEVILGNVLSAGLGQAPARQASLNAGLGVETPCTTINKVCSSGLKSLVFGSQSIALGHSHTVVGGGFESMSKAPFLLFNVNYLIKIRQEKVPDSVINNYTMPSVMTVFKTHSIKCPWETALKRLLMISKLPEKHKMIIASFPTKDTLKPLRMEF
jgi:hypothetical protein